jgi:hypothetical protein
MFRCLPVVSPGQQRGEAGEAVCRAEGRPRASRRPHHRVPAGQPQVSQGMQS